MPFMLYCYEKCGHCEDGYIILETILDQKTGKEIVNTASCDKCLTTIVVPNEPIEDFGFSKTPQYTPEKMLKIQEKLGKKYKHQALDPILSSKYRNLYAVELPKEFKKHMDGDDTPLYSPKGIQISTGWNRIIIGDYGAFLEITPKQILLENLKCAKGQEYRFNNEKYSAHTKFNWLTTKDDSYIKIYEQKKSLEYAEYRANMLYVSPYQVKT